jgi:hypothetical protein
MEKTKPKFCILQKLKEDWMRRDLTKIQARQEMFFIMGISFRDCQFVALKCSMYAASLAQWAIQVNSIERRSGSPNITCGGG